MKYISQLDELMPCLFQACAVVVSCGSQNSCNIHHVALLFMYIYLIRNRDFTRVKYGLDYILTKKKEIKIRLTISER